METISNEGFMDLYKCKRKAVNFCESLRVVLIPSRVDYKAAGLLPSLWWTGSDYLSFQQAARSEIRLLSIFEGIGLDLARKKLYQPSETDKDDMSLSCVENAIQSPVPKGRSKISYFSADEGASNDEFDEASSTANRARTRSRTSSWEELTSWQCVPLKEYFPFEFIERRSRRLQNYAKNSMTSEVGFCAASLIFLAFVIVPLILGIEKLIR